jgi:hypothetical protein
MLPIAEDHQFVMLALPMMLLVESRRRSVPRPDRFFVWGFAAFGVMLVVPLDYTAHRFESGWAVVLAYPRLYATWGLWAMVIREIRRQSSDGNNLSLPPETRAHASP